MFGITGLLTSSDYRNGSPGPIEAVSNLVIFSVSTVSDSNWSLLIQDYKLIKARNEDFADVGTVYSYTSLPTITFNIGMNGTHDATIGSAYGSSYASPSTGGKSNLTYSAGSHNHTASVNLAGFLPSSILTKLYKRNPNSISFYSLPIGSLVFGANLNITGLSATSSYDNRYICSSSISAGATGGSTTSTISFNTSNGGEHFHDGPVNNFDQTTFNQTGYGQQTGSRIDTSGQQSHAHTGSITISQRKQYVKLRTYQVTGSNVFISSGMIFGFISAINDPNWFCCNGQTVRGYTTPNLVDRYVMCGNNSISSHNVTPSAINDVNDINIMSYTLDNNTWNHRHGIGNIDYQNTTTYLPCTRYHSYANFSHTHAITTTDGVTSYSYEPSYFNLIFYIYLP
jgi:hypothetical protein